MPGKVLVEGPFQGVVFQEDLPVEGLVGSFRCHSYSSVEDLHLASNVQISGDNENRLYYTEFWEFVWQDDRWVLANIYQEDALEVAKIARGE